jgi:hypothetical protein
VNLQFYIFLIKLVILKPILVNFLLRQSLPNGDFAAVDKAEIFFPVLRGWLVGKVP